MSKLYMPMNAWEYDPTEKCVKELDKLLIDEPMNVEVNVIIGSMYGWSGCFVEMTCTRIIG